jgi:NTE family protein
VLVTTGDTTGPATHQADLVLEGGGVKGIGLAGAILTLDEAGYRFQRVAGTSAGAVAAALVAALNKAGRPLSELKGMLESIDFQRFMRKSTWRRLLGPLGDAEQLVFRDGLYDSGYLVEWLEPILADLGVVTFGDLRRVDAGDDKNLRDDQQYSLVVITSDISRGKAVRLPWDYREYGLVAEEQKVVDAVRASMSIPFFFEPRSFDAPKVTIDGTTWPAGRVTWVDGGMLDNFPVDMFDRTDGLPNRWKTIGIKLSARTVTAAAPRAIDGVFDEAIACLRTVLENADRFYVAPDIAARTIFVDNGGVKATRFDLSDTEKATLFTNGQCAAQRWVEDTHDAKQ